MNNSSLVSTETSSPLASELRTISLFQINNEDIIQYKARSGFGELRESIKNNGIKEPLTVTFSPSYISKDLDRYEILDGRARLVSLLLNGSGSTPIPVNVVQMSSSEALEIRRRRKISNLLDHAFGVSAEHDREDWDHQLYEIAEMIVFRKNSHIAFSAKYLDEIARGCQSKKHIKKARTVSAGYNCFYEAMHWWIIVLEKAGSTRHHPTGPKSTIYEEMSTMLCFYAGMKREIAYSKGNNDRIDAWPIFEYLNRYRNFTRSVCAYAQEVWPDENLQRLFDEV